MVGSSCTSVDWTSDSSGLVSCLEGVWLFLRLSLALGSDEAALLAGSGQKLVRGLINHLLKHKCTHILY